jgi:hypothetical protein
MLLVQDNLDKATMVELQYLAVVDQIEVILAVAVAVLQPQVVMLLRQQAQEQVDQVHLLIQTGAVQLLQVKI